eukprot:3938504-Rhodomonas_salina.1
MSPLWSVPVCTGLGSSPCLVSTDTWASLASSAQACTTDSCPRCHAVLPCMPQTCAWCPAGSYAFPHAQFFLASTVMTDGGAGCPTDMHAQTCHSRLEKRLSRPALKSLSHPKEECRTVVPVLAAPIE